MINDSINRFLGVLCYPFTSMEVFRQDLISEYIEAARTHNKVQAEQIRKSLRSQLVGYIRRNYNVYSYDEIYLYLEECFLYSATEYEDGAQLYYHIMRKMASALISHRDGRIVFKYWRNKEDEELFGGFAGNNKVTLFHSLNCHIPMDVIAITYMIRNQEKRDTGCLNYFYGNIEVADLQLSRVLELGVAENHLHKGVSRTFSSIWDSLMEPLTPKTARTFLGREFVNGTREHNDKVLFYILGCGIIRAYLALEMRRNGKQEGSRYGAELDGFVKSFENGQALESYFLENFQKEKEGQETGEKEIQKDRQKEITAYFVGLWDSLGEYLPEDAFQGKLCTQILGEDPDLHTLDENVFLYYALRKIDDLEDINRIEDIERRKYTATQRKCIMQYLRVRNYLFHISVQQKTIKGLDYFQQEHYSVNSALNHANIRNFWENAIREQLQNQDLHKIEFRSSMPESYKSFKKDVANFLRAYGKILQEDYCFYDGEKYIPYRRIPQVGLVIHFLKRPDDSVPEKCLQNGVENCSYCLFGKLQESYKKQIEIFKQLRTEFGELSRYLVGIDAASLENSTPVWVFAPIYENARDSSIESIGRKGGSYIQSLGFTFHAGEDFRHILSGLRRIDEAAEYLKFHAGDRIGHGIALGMLPRKWKSQNPVIIIPQIEALENYLWAYDTLSKNYSDFQATILAYIEKQVNELSGKIYGTVQGGEEKIPAEIGIEVLLSGYRRLFSGEGSSLKDEKTAAVVEENLCAKLFGGEKIVWDARLLAAARHCKKFVKEMERPIHYEVTEQDILIVEELQKILKKKLGRKGIVIEVNPSSNTAIADLDVTEENQFYQINRINDEENLLVCINSDDPSVFNTNVSNELAYIYYGMLEQNISRESVLLWIDRIRKNGLNSSFIHHPETDELLVNRLFKLLGEI